MNIKDYENIELIIFDCDGVLIDSEIISVSVFTKQLNTYGLNISMEYVQNNFVGHSYLNVKKLIFEDFNFNLPNKFENIYLKELLNKFENDLIKTKGIEEILLNLSSKKCIATSSSLKRANESLRIVNLSKYFKNKIYSTFEMGNKGKPEPDIFLKIAKEYNISIEKILVIEDSLLGIQGAKRAGIKVWHYVGASHLQDWDYNFKYEFKPDFIFDDFNLFYTHLPHLESNKEK